VKSMLCHLGHDGWNFYNLTIGRGLLRLDSYHTSNMLLDNDRSGFGTVPADKTHVHVLMARLPPRFLPLLLERLGLNPFGGSCEGGWDEFADVRFTCSCNS